jgi:putative ABC transport system permease protein
MWTLFKLALRNVFRYKRRTIITFSAISLGLGLLVIGMSLYEGADKQTFNSIINTQTGHLKILAQGYFENRDDLPLKYTLDDPQQLKRIVRNTPGITEVESRILFQATLINGIDELPCLGMGIEPETDAVVFKIKESLKKGEFLEETDQKILIGQSLAKDLGLDVGDVCVLRMFISTEDLVWNALDLEIKGIFETENPIVDNSTVFIPLPLAQKNLGLENTVTEMAVRIDDQEQLTNITASLEESFSSAGIHPRIVSFREISSDFIELARMKSRVQALIPLIMLLIATLGIVNTMLMAVMERVREIGMLAAMGMRKKEIMFLFVAEGSLIGFFGSLTGCFLGGLGGWYLETKGLDFSFLGEEIIDSIMSSFPVKDVFYGDLTTGILLFTLIFGTAIAALVSLYPAYRAAKLDPAKALRDTG